MASVGSEPGWPAEFPVNPDGSVEVGLIVLSRSGKIQGRTGGGRKPCKTLTCDGWFISVQWETGQYMWPCSKGWTYYPHSNTVQITAGGEISARDPAPPRPESEWPSQDELHRKIGWREST